MEMIPPEIRRDNLQLLGKLSIAKIGEAMGN